MTHPNPKDSTPGATPGTLYIVGTPIGNLGDISLRALEVLKTVDIVAAENVGHTKSLCQHYGIRKKVIPYHQHNQGTQTRTILGWLLSGKDVALVTDAGTPGISDPGVYLIDRAVKKGVPVTPVPGPSAVITALSISGLPTARFVFLGFLSSKRGRRRKELNALRDEPRTMVFFESPHRLMEMLEDLKDILGNRQMVLHKEMTKMFEEAMRGRISEILEELLHKRIRGEYTLVIRGSDDKKSQKPEVDNRIMDRIESLLEARDQSLRDIAETISREEGLRYRDIYKRCLRTKNDLEDQRRHGSH